MKTRVILLSIGTATAALLAGCASHSDATASNGDHYDYVTGSYIPQDVQKTGPATNGKDNLRIVDQSDLQRSGGADVNQALRNLGATH